MRTLPPFKDMTVADCAGLSAETINAIIEENYVPVEKRQAAINAMIDSYYDEMRNFSHQNNQI